MRARSALRRPSPLRLGVPAGCLAALGLLALSAAAPAWAHEVLHGVERAAAVVVSLTYADGTPFAYESYEIFLEGASVPCQVGRTDEKGRVAFLPDRDGRWRIKAVSDDGHGVEFSFEATAGGGVRGAGGSLFERYGRLLIGVAFIFGLFGLLQLFHRRRES